MTTHRSPFGVVSKAALLTRIKRRLAPRYETLVRSRSRRARLELGDYYVVDLVLTSMGIG
ncbi:MAG: hypothetical protein U0234_22890 [Sandaracinus sp.]